MIKIFLETLLQGYVLFAAFVFTPAGLGLAIAFRHFCKQERANKLNELHREWRIVRERNRNLAMREDQLKIFGEEK